MKVAICTDMTTRIQYRKIRQLGLADRVDAIVTSEEVGMEKPAPVMFLRALEKLGLRPEEAAYFGDSLSKDIEGAHACGLRAFWFVADRKVPNAAAYPKVHTYRDACLEELFAPASSGCNADT